MVITGEAPWFMNIVSYLASGYLVKNQTSQQKKKFFANIKYYFWDEPYIFWSCVDNIIRRCVFRNEARDMICHCHNVPTGGHHGAQYTEKKVFDAGFC